MKKKDTTERLRTLNHPKKISVATTPAQLPGSGTSVVREVPQYRDTILPMIEVEDDNGKKKVLEVLDTWRVDDEWWRKEISRKYYELLLEGGMRLIVYEDRPTGEWFKQL